MKRSAGRRGYALMILLGYLVVLGAAATRWRSSFRAFQPQVVRAPARAQARALARSAWERARLELRAQRPATADRPLDDDRRVRVEAEPVDAGWRVTITASVRRPVGQEWVTQRLHLELDDALTVRRWRESGP